MNEATGKTDIPWRPRRSIDAHRWATKAATHGRSPEGYGFPADERRISQ